MGVETGGRVPKTGVNYGVLAMLLAGFFFGMMVLCTKAAGKPFVGRPLPASETTLARFVVGILLMLPLSRPHFGRPGVNLLGTNRRGLLKRGIFGGLSIYAYFLSLQYTLITHAQLLNCMSLFFAPLFAAWWLKERMTPRTMVACGVALVGTVMITRPGSGSAATALGDLFGLFSGLISGAAVVTIRQLRQTETAWSIFFYLSVIGLPVALFACWLQPLVMPTPVGWLLLLAISLTSVGAQMAISYGYKYVRAAEGVLITLSQVAYGALFGAWFLGESLTGWTFAGGALILAAAFWSSREKPAVV